MRHRPLPALVIVLAVVLGAVVGLGACSDDSSSGSSTTTVPVVAGPSATGRELATGFMTILQQGDRDALADLLADGFVIQRADGSTATLGEPLAPRLSTFAWRDGEWRMVSHANFNLPAASES